MSRLKRPIDYVNTLRLNPNREKRELGETLHGQYQRWTRSLRLGDFLGFMQTIQEGRDRIGAAQLFGKFRAYSLEEFVYRLIRARVSTPEPLGVYWGERCLIWRGSGREYGMEVDVLVGEKLDGFVQPVVAVDAKVELDASRLKTALASFLLLKRCHPHARCLLVYVIEEVDPPLLRLTEPWIDRVYRFSAERDETGVFVESVRAAVKQV
jgi:hypothetical protein